MRQRWSCCSLGAAYVLARTVGGWSQQAYLKASNTAPSNAFGKAVAITTDHGATLKFSRSF